MILVNAPHIMGWLLLYYASSLTDLYIAGKSLFSVVEIIINRVVYFYYSCFAGTWCRSVNYL